MPMRVRSERPKTGLTQHAEEAFTLFMTMDRTHSNNWQKLFNILVILGVIDGVNGKVQLIGLPTTVSVPENSASGRNVYSFQVLSDPATSVATGFPEILNSSPLTTAFIIAPKNTSHYEIMTTGAPTLDYETAPHIFELQIYVKDNANDSDLKIVKVLLSDVNEPPRFLGNMQTTGNVISIEEENISGPIYTVYASDPDQGDNLTFSLTPTSAPFTISSEGVVSSTKKFDYETDNHTYVLTVAVKDSGGLAISGMLTVNILNINDNTPYFTIKSTTITIPEEQPAGTTVTTITAKDPDDVGFISNLIFSIDDPSTEYFSINKFTGVIQVAMRIDRDAKPFQQTPAIPVQVVVRDSPSGGHSNSTIITIIIKDKNDNPPVCTPPDYRIELPESKPNNTLVISLTCVDIDVEPPNNQFNFSGLDGLGSNERFTLQPPGSGSIVLIGNLDFEASNNIAVGNEYTLSVAVRDIASPYYEVTVYVYVTTIPENEHPPVFNPSSYTFNVSEMNGIGSVVGKVTATDKDFPFIGITYSILTGGSTFGYRNIFWIDPSDGTLQLLARPDYEITSQYILTVQAVDQDPKNPLTVTVNILKANDEKPICEPKSSSLRIPVDLRVGTNIQGFQLTCTDRDSSPKSFRYKIGSGNFNNHFGFSPTAGSNVTTLILKSPFDYSSGLDTVWDYKLLVYITDGNLASRKTRSTDLTQTGTVVIDIKVFIPGLTTAATTPNINYIIDKENVYSASAWYVPFIIALGAMLLLGLLGYLIYFMSKHIHCARRPKPDKVPLIEKREGKKLKKEVVTELTKVNTIFDGEARDPVTGKMYEYNSKSGARRWKDTSIPMNPLKTEPVMITVPNALENIPKEKVRKGTSDFRKRDVVMNDKAAEPQVDNKPATGQGTLNPQEKPKDYVSGRASPAHSTKPKSQDQPKSIHKKEDLSDV
ncbi:cadherin-related family member 3 [Latimeria chalumnae]|uniref:cadherin-related family member 3 n=1 Tax=Latimeria chalumnae TaxID=7897 RepID=UPI00313AC4A3